MICVSEHVYALEKNDDFDRPYLYYICGSQRSILFDCGASPNHFSLMQEELQNEGLKDPDAVILSHWHWDHTFGLQACTLPSYCTKKTFELLEKVSHWEWNDEAMRLRLETGEEIPFCDKYMRLEYEDLSQIKVSLPQHIINEECLWDLGDVHVRLIPRDSPHSRDSLSALVEEDQVFLDADADGVDFNDNHAKYDINRLKSWIDFCAVLPYEICGSGHRPIMHKREHMVWLRNKYDDALKEEIGEDSDQKDFNDYLNGFRSKLRIPILIILLVVVLLCFGLLAFPDIFLTLFGLN